MNLFIKADEVGQYIAQNKWATIGEVDTTLVLNIGKAALNAGKEDMANQYFTKLADANIKGLKDTEDESYKVPYQWLTLHYKEAKDEPKMPHLANNFFPQTIILILY